jgi:hypothetical protein
MSDEIPFRTLTMDFILALPEEMDTALTVICKASKRVTIIPGKSTGKAFNWAEALSTIGPLAYS